MIDAVIKWINKVISEFEFREGTLKSGIPVFYNGQYTLTKWNKKTYEMALQNVLKLFPNNDSNIIRVRFSGTIKAILRAKASSDDKRKLSEVIAIEAQEFVDTLKSFVVERTVYLPLEGIEFCLDKLELCQCTLYNNAQGMLPELIQNRDCYFAMQHKIDALEECGCYLEAKFLSDHGKSVKDALYKANHIISLLNFFTGSTRDHVDMQQSEWYEEKHPFVGSLKRNIGIWGAASDDTLIYYESYKNVDRLKKVDYRIDFRNLKRGLDAVEQWGQMIECLVPEDGKYWLHLVDKDVAHTLQDPSYEQLVNCFLQRSEIERKLHQALNWFSKAINTAIPSEQFLFFAIALETLVVGNESKSEYASQGSITQKISERAAFLCSDGFESRMAAEKKVKKLYGIRSKIVHEGTDASKEESLMIEEITRTIIKRFAVKRFASLEEFLRWVKQQQYT